MSFFRLAIKACGHRGRVADLVAASKASIEQFNPFGPDDWRKFGFMAFQSRNQDVLEYILCQVADPNELLIHIQGFCFEWDTVSKHLINWWIAGLPDLIRKNIHNIALALDEYNENSSYIRSLLIVNPSFCTYAIDKAMDNSNSTMLYDAFQVYGSIL